MAGSQPRKAAIPRPATLDEFKRGVGPALRDEKARTSLNGVIERIASPQVVVQCLDLFCKSFDPDRPPKGVDHPLPRGLAVAYALFMRAAKLVHPINGLAPKLKALDSAAAADSDKRQPQSVVWARRWRRLEPSEQARVRAEIEDALKRAGRGGTTLIGYLIERYAAEKGNNAPTLDDLLKFEIGSPAERADFNGWVEKVSKPWRARHNLKSRMPLAQAIEAIDAAFLEFRDQLTAAIKTPMDFLKLLNFARDARLEGNAWGFDHEIYLEVVAKGLHRALDSWTIESCLRPRAFVGDDEQFILRAIPFGEAGHSRLLMMNRLSSMEKGPAKIQETSLQRRRLFMAGAYNGLELPDEIELQAILARMDVDWRKNPVEVVQRNILAPSAKAAFNNRLWINQKVEDGFTILFIETTRDGNKWAYIEVHAIPGVMYKGNGSALSALNEQAFYKALAKNAEALTAFLLFYLEVLGWAMDIATAGIGGGFRHIVWEFAKERLKDKLLEKGFEALGITNPWIQTAVGFGIGFVKLPGAKVHAEFEAPHVDGPHAGGPHVDGPHPTSGALEAGTARVDALASRTGIDAADAEWDAVRARAMSDGSDPVGRPGSGRPQPQVDAAPMRPQSRTGSDEGSFFDELKAKREAKVAEGQARRSASEAPAEAAKPKTIEDTVKEARDNALGKRTDATGQAPISETEDAAMQAADVSQMRDYDARQAAEAAELQAARESHGAIEVKSAAAGGSGSGQGTVGKVTGVQGGRRGPSSRGRGRGGSKGVGGRKTGTAPGGGGRRGGSGSGRPGASSRGASRKVRRNPHPLTDEALPAYYEPAGNRTLAVQRLKKNAGLVETRKLEFDELHNNGGRYQHNVAGKQEYKIPVRDARGKTAKGNQGWAHPDGVAHAKAAPGKVDIIEAKFEDSIVDVTNWTDMSKNFAFFDGKMRQMRNLALVAKENAGDIDMVRYCCSSPAVHDVFGTLKSNLDPDLQKFVSIELDGRMPQILDDLARQGRNVPPLPVGYSGPPDLPVPPVPPPKGPGR